MSTNSEHSASQPLNVEDVSDIDDPRRPLTRALRLGAWALVALTVLSLMAWGGVYGLQLSLIHI